MRDASHTRATTFLIRQTVGGRIRYTRHSVGNGCTTVNILEFNSSEFLFAFCPLLNTIPERRSLRVSGGSDVRKVGRNDFVSTQIRPFELIPDGSVNSWCGKQRLRDFGTH
jgi:hypothetical protein